MIEDIRDLLIAVLAIYSLVWLVGYALPEHSEPEPSCSCKGKPDCRYVKFDSDGTGTKFIYGAIWSDRETCIIEDQGED